MNELNNPALQLRTPAEEMQMKWLMISALILITIFCCFPHDVLADTTAAAGANGDSIWVSFKSVVFSGWGMLFAGIIGFSGVYVGATRTIGQGVMVLSLGFVLFLIPALVMAFMKAGQSLAT
jgi:hypothetical protein